MFTLQSIKPRAMKIQKATVDWITMEENGLDTYPTFESRILNNTSGTLAGGKKAVMSRIKYHLSHNKELKLSEEEVYDQVVEKIMGDPDYNPSRSNSLEAYCIYLVTQALKTVTKNYYEKHQRHREVEFVQEGQNKGDGDEYTTSTDAMLLAGSLGSGAMSAESMLGRPEMEFTMTEDEARDGLIETLKILNLVHKRFTTREASINPLLLIQAYHVIDIFSYEEKRIKARFPGALDRDLKLIKAGIENINVTLKLGKTQNIKNLFKGWLADEFVYGRQFKDAIIALVQILEFLEIPLIALNENIIEDDYIRKLQMARDFSHTVCVTEYEYPPLPDVPTRYDMNFAAVSAKLDNNAALIKNIDLDMNEVLSKVRLSDLRRLDAIAKEVKQRASIQNQKSIVSKAKMQGKQVDRFDILNQGELIKAALKTKLKSIIVSSPSTGPDDAGIGGPLCPEALAIMERPIQEYLTRMRFLEEEKLEKMKDWVRRIAATKNLDINNNGYLVERNTGHFYHHVNDKGENFLLNIHGYMVYKYVDYYIRGENNKGEDDRIVRQGKNSHDFSVIRVYNVFGELIYSGS